MRLALLILIAAFLVSPAFAAHYALVLDGDAAGTAAAKRTEIGNSHEPIRNALRSRGFRVTSEADTFLNAIFVDADASRLAELASMPGVRYVRPLRRFHRTLDHAEQLINVPLAWAQIGGSATAGAGVKIAVIDTGIDNTHPALNVPAQTASAPICPVVSDCVYTNGKVIVARSYVRLLNSFAAFNSRPDDYSARDRVGHGTAVAMAAAGLTAAGPSDTITGVAPGALLGNYKVFGSPGVNDFTTGDAVISALEDAYKDGMNIAILSLGAAALSGPLDTGAACGLSAGQFCDLEATAVQNAVNAGMVVVVAAGNDGPGLNTIDTPGTAPAAITVGATTNSHNWSNPLAVNGLGTFHSLLGDGPVPSTPVTGTLSDVAAVGDPQACSAPPAGSLSGLIALVARGTCTFAVKVQNLEAAGATGAIFTNNPGDDSLVIASGLNGTTIPATLIGYTDGQTIRTFLAGNPMATVSISPTLGAFPVSTYNEMTAFSSRGPVLGSTGLKPDLTAAGESLYLAGQSYDPNGELYTPNGFLVSQGTSFAAPQIAGLAALVKQSLSGLSAAALKSAVVNSAAQIVTDGGPPASVLSMGAGLANAAAAVSTQLVANPANISFGATGNKTLPPAQTIQLTNVGTTILTLSALLNNALNNAQISVSPVSLTLPAGQTSSITVSLIGSVPSPGIYQGFLTITGAANAVNIPYLYIVGDGVPANMLSLAGNGDDGTVAQQSAGGYVVFRVVDQYGVPVPNLPGTFKVIGGNGQLLGASTHTDNYGQGYAEMVLGSTPGANVYTATAGGLSATFTANGRYQPTIAPNGVVNGASFTQTAAPGSYVSIFGYALADTTASFSTPYLPIAINNVSVSFDTASVSVPGHLTFISPTQVNLQVPWELAGASSAQMKVSLEDSSGTVYPLSVSTYAPAFFESQGVAAALDVNNQPITSGHPATQGGVVQLFGNGLGPVTNQPASGDPAPFNPLATVTGTPLTVTIGGLPAVVQFAGLSPGSVGLYQMNAVVPQTGPGVQTIMVSVGGVNSPVSHLPVQ